MSNIVSTSSPNPWGLIKVFTKIGLLAFGGWSGAYIMTKQELVDRLGWLSEDQVNSALTFSQLLPGSTAIGIISGSGYRILGWSGAIAATFSYLLAPAGFMLILTIFYFRYSDLPGFSAPLNGMAAALTGLLLANVYQLARKYNVNWQLWAITICSLVAYFVFHLSHPLIVLLAGVIYLLSSKHFSFTRESK